MATPSEATAAQLIFGPNVLANSSISTTKFLSACFAGAAAGILGLENWAGFILFLASTLLTAGIVHAVNCKGKPKKYFQGGVMELINPGQDNAFTFVLVWTLFYGIVHGV
ncbi:hypothetical protein GALMADRAFT_133595 [Galerina marginata CBS 339.88]|uniref:ER membrane protein complex subunit 6 n=1 Tax=Galerina marginata (strain CBS 339.88) TaxID=685588 RepID=A0A067TWB0_GALM3|nr:hypothetical protein GALMADRAFT_133595 [Galerina marginata CBS 339.88]